VREVDLLRLLVQLVHREVDDPAEVVGALLDQAELLGRAGAGEAGELGGLALLAGGEEDAVVRAEAELGDQLAGGFLAMVLGDRAAELAALLGDVAEAGKASSAPTRSCRRRTCGCGRRCSARDGAHDIAASTILANRPKPSRGNGR
jgi:hypothetical protein